MVVCCLLRLLMMLEIAQTGRWGYVEVAGWFILLRGFWLDLTFLGSQFSGHLHLRFLVLCLLVGMLKMMVTLMLSLLMVKLVEIFVGVPRVVVQ